MRIIDLGAPGSIGGSVEMQAWRSWTIGNLAPVKWKKSYPVDKKPVTGKRNKATRQKAIRRDPSLSPLASLR